MLIGIHLLRSAEANAALTSVGTARAGALPDEVAFELGDAGEAGHDHLVGVSRGISPGFGDGLEAGMKRELTQEESVEGWTLAPNELLLMMNKSGPGRVGFAAMLNFFQAEERFPLHKGEIPSEPVG